MVNFHFIRFYLCFQHRHSENKISMILSSKMAFEKLLNVFIVFLITTEGINILQYRFDIRVPGKFSAGIPYPIFKICNVFNT